MKIFRSYVSWKNQASGSRRTAQTVGFVPTMGYLHEGHLSLVRRARRENDRVVVSIFVNPLQFGPREDLKRYPRNEKGDLALLKREGVDAVYLPSATSFYPKEFQTQVSVGKLSRPLCGRFRPGHFAGVATVVAKLLMQLRPDRMYLGQKDFQQCRVIEQMVSDLDLGVRIIRCPVVREKDGLAMSSRNVFLRPSERHEAAGIRRSLLAVRRAAQEGLHRVPALQALLTKELKKARGARVEYAEIVDARTLEPVLQLSSKSPALAAVAVYFGKTRLIDNLLLRTQK